MNIKQEVGFYIFILLLLILSTPSYAYNLRKINNPGNIPNNPITAMYQDTKGLIWIGTNNGLNTYDGQKVSAYSQFDSNKILNGTLINRITGTNEDVMWVQTYYGLSKIGRTINKSSFHEKFNRISFSAMDNRNNFYFIQGQGNNSIYYSLSQGGKFGKIDVPNLITGEILNLFIDSNNRLWIFKVNGKNLCYSIEIDNQQNVTLIQKEDYRQTSPLLYCFCDGKQVFLIDQNYKLYEFDANTQKQSFIADLKEQLFRSGDVAAVVKFNEDYFFGFKTDGLYILKKHQDKYMFEKIPVNSGITCLMKDNHQNLVWIGTDRQGIYTYSIDKYSIRSTLFSDFMLKIRQPVEALFLDRENTLWIGSRGDGILKIYDYDPDKNISDCKMEDITTRNSQLNDNSVYCFKESSHNILWIGSDSGLNYYSVPEKRIRKLTLSDNNLDIKYIHDVYEQDSILWIASRGMGIVKAGISWVGNTPSLNVIKKFTIKHEDVLSNCFISIYPENDSIIRITNKGEGAFKINTITSEMDIIKFENSISNEVNAIINDRNKGYLIGTNFGLIRYNPHSYTILSEENGFPANMIYCIQHEFEANYWLSTSRGLVYYNSYFGTSRIFDDQDGVYISKFNNDASYKDRRKGILFFGGINGFVTIKENYFDETQHYMPSVYFNKLTISGKDYNIADFLSREDGIPSVTLNHDQNFFSVSVGAIDHINISNYAFFYKLEGKDNQWISNGKSKEVILNDLKPGKYKLRVKYYNTVLNKESYSYGIRIKILPPWYLSGWAYCAYTFLAVIFIIALISYFVIRNKKREIQIRQKLEQQQKEEVYESKLQFFINIAHEFCTPLTLIYGPCKRILSKKNTDESTIKYAQIIQQNAERLNSLIRDLIEFKRIETGYQKPQIEQLPLSGIITKLADSFSDMAESQHIRFEKEIPPAIYWNSNKNFILTITTNLLSNAFKYTTDSKIIKLCVRATDNELQFTISNTGKGIREEDIPHLFDRYKILHNFEYGDNPASWSRNGLGLAIAYNMILLLGGTIEVESIPDKWTHFKVKLPHAEINTTDIARNNIWEMGTGNMESRIKLTLPRYHVNKSKPMILIIDDEPEMLWFICDLFAEDFNVMPVNNSHKALDAVKTVHPHIIICDILMPDMDGISLTKELKSNEKTAHIPLILLSGRQDTDSQIEGINAGAELYITKPFSPDYLRSTVIQLMKRKETLKEYYSSPLSSFELTDGKLLHKEDKKLMKEIAGIINKNIKNKDLSQGKRI